MRLDLAAFEQELATRRTPLDVLRAALAELSAWMPHDVSCALLVDPSLLIEVHGDLTGGYPAKYVGLLTEFEHFAPHPAALRSMRNGKSTVWTLSGALRGRVEDSPYYQEVLRPQGFREELRVMLRDGSQVWGMLVLGRAEGDTPFTLRDEEIAALLAAPAAAALQRALLLQGTDTGGVSDAPGRLIIGSNGVPASASPTAHAWLELLEDDGDECRQLRGTVDAALFSGSARSEFTLPSGVRLAARAWPIRQDDGERVVAVSLGPAPSGPPSALVLGSYGLTEQEEAVAWRMLRGGSPNEIAARLDLPLETVERLLANVYERTGLPDRRTLFSDILCRHYLPFMGSGVLSTDGRRLPAD